MELEHPRRGKKEPPEAIGMERRSTAEGLQVHAAGRVMTEQGGASGKREPGVAEVARNQGKANRSTGQGGAR